MEERWSVEDALNIKAMPRYPVPSQVDKSEIKARLADEEAGAESEQPGRRKDDANGRRDDVADEDTGANLQSPQARDPREEAFRRFKITDAMLTKYGYMEGCDQSTQNERGSFI